MNYAMVIHMLGWVSCFEAAFLLLPLLVSVIYGESCAFAFLVVAALCALLGLPLVLKRPAKRTMASKDGLVIVAFSWILLSVFGALPFVISGEIPFFVDASLRPYPALLLPEQVFWWMWSPLSHGTLFWRSFTHWIGGMGILVFILAILPMKGGSSVFLMKAESPGPSVSKLVPRIRETAFILYAIYFAMTVVECVLLLAGGMPLFDTLCTAFGTAGTGGFGIKADSFGNYSPYLQGVVAVFMMLFGINFNLYYLCLRKKFSQAVKSLELWAYLLIYRGLPPVPLP